MDVQKGSPRPRPGGGKKAKAPGGGVKNGRGNRRKCLFLLCGAGGLLVLGLAAFVLLRPKALFLVDEDFSAAWNRLLRESPRIRAEVRPLPPGSGAPADYFSAGRYGFVISRSGPKGEEIPGLGYRRFPNLSQTRRYEGWTLLAADPWMVFRRHLYTEPVRRNLLDRRGEDPGSFLIPGANPEAVEAWAAQTVQERPGVFPSEPEAWEAAKGAVLFRYNFQEGAPSYTWVQVWPILFRETGVYWLYAPISRARALSPYQMGLLDATRFPDPENWNEYGMQAGLLWAAPVGDEKHRKKLDALQKWLDSAETQTKIANFIEWIPVHPESKDYNTIAWETKIAWLRSSFVWQGPELRN
jgi:hypothetical protein